MWRRTTENGQDTAAPAEMPRDVEALERVIEALETGVNTELDAHRAVIEALVPATGMAYGGSGCRPAPAGSRCGRRSGRSSRP